MPFFKKTSVLVRKSQNFGVFRNPLLFNDIWIFVIFRRFFRSAVRPLRDCNGAPVASRRARRCNSTSMPLETNGGLTARRHPATGLPKPCEDTKKSLRSLFFEHFRNVKFLPICFTNPPSCDHAEQLAGPSLLRLSVVLSLPIFARLKKKTAKTKK